MMVQCEAAAESGGQELSESRATLDSIRLEGCRPSPMLWRRDCRLAIRDLDLTVRVGETTAIAGPSGAGKSTIADLIMGLVAP